LGAPFKNSIASNDQSLIASYDGKSVLENENRELKLSTNGEFLSNLYKNKINKDEEEAM